MPFKSDRQRKFLFENKPEVAREFAKKVYAYGGFMDATNDRMQDFKQRMQQGGFKASKKNRKKYQGPGEFKFTSTSDELGYNFNKSFDYSPEGIQKRRENNPYKDMSLSEKADLGLTTAGIALGPLGIIPDAINTASNLGQGAYHTLTGDTEQASTDYKNATLAGLSMIPIAGQAVAATKIGAKVAKTVKGTKELLKKSVPEHALYRVVDATGNVQAAKFGSTIPEATTVGRRSGIQGTIQKSTDFDHISATTDQKWLTEGKFNLFDRYGGKNPYVVKLQGHEGKIHQVAEDATSDVLAKIRPGSYTNMGVAGPQGQNITSIIGPKGSKVANVKGVMSQSEYIKALNLNPNFKFKKGGFKDRDTYQGPEAGDLTSQLITGGIGSKEQLKASIPTERISPEVEAGPAAEIITEHDKNWDYKKEAGAYSTKKKDSDKWITPTEKSSAGQGIRAVFGDSDYDYVSDWEGRQPSTTVPSLGPGGTPSISMSFTPPAAPPTPEKPAPDDYRQYKDTSIFGRAKDYMRDKLDMVGDIELPSFSEVFNQVSKQGKEGIDNVDLPGADGLIDRAREFASDAKNNITETGSQAADWVQRKVKNIDIIPDHVENKAKNIYSRAIRKANELKDNLVDDMKTLPQNMKERGAEAVSDMQKQMDNLNRVIEKGEQNIEQAVSEKLNNNLFTRKILPVLKSVDVSKLQELPDDLRERIMKNESIDIDSLPTVDKVKIYNAFNNIKQETQSFGGQLSDAGKDVINTISDTGKSYYNKLKDKISEVQTTLNKPKEKKWDAGFIKTGMYIDKSKQMAYTTYRNPKTGELEWREDPVVVGRKLTEGKNPVPYLATLKKNWKNEDGSYKKFPIPGHGQMTGPEAKKLYDDIGGGATPEGMFIFNQKYDKGGRGYSKTDEHGNPVYQTITLENGDVVPAMSKLTGIDATGMFGNVPGTTPKGHYTSLYETVDGEEKFIQKSSAAFHPILKGREEAISNPDIATNLSAGCIQTGDCAQKEIMNMIHWEDIRKDIGEEFNPGVDTLAILNTNINPEDKFLFNKYWDQVKAGKLNEKQKKTIAERILALLN